MKVVAGRPASVAGPFLRRLTLLLFVVSTIGTTLDLVLLGHFENPRQLAPLLLMPTGLLLLAWHRIEQGPRGTRAFQVAMVLFIATGVVGVWFHYSGNAAFELEIRPAIGGWNIVRESLTGPAPALAPATMAQLGMLGLIYTYRHPFLERKPSQPESRAVLRVVAPTGGLRGRCGSAAARIAVGRRRA